MNLKLILIILFISISGIGILLEKEDEMYIVSDKEVQNEEISYINENDNSINKEVMNKDTVNEEKESLDNGEDKINTKNETDNLENQEITVFISGEVNTPKVISIENKKRLSDAIDLVGGLTSNADLNKVNLAMKLVDEGHYVIPKIGEETDSININQPNNNLSNSKVHNENNLNDNQNNIININTASISELDTLNGIGEATANKIVSYREENGNFNSIEDIKNVNGIGEKKFEEIKNYITVD